MKKIVQFLAVLTLLAVSTKVSAQVPCPAPTGLSTIIVDTNAVVTWSGTADAYLVKYRPLGMSTWESGTSTTTSMWLYDLCASTTYEVEVYGLCGCDTSGVAVDTFSMACGTLRHFPYAETFEAGGDSCWTSIGDGWDDGSGWELREISTMAHSGSNYMYSPAITYGTNPASWLVSPAIAVPDDANGFMLTWQGRQTEGGNSYRVRVSTSTSSTSNFTTTLADFPNESVVWTEHNVSLDSFAGQTVYVAFEHYSSNYGGGILVDDVKLQTLYQPVVAITGVRTIDIDSVAVLTAHLMSGSSSGLAYEWSTYRYDAVYGSTDSVEFHISYPTSGYDTITLVGSNDYGTDTATFIIFARDLSPISEFPYSTGFEEGHDRNWTSAGGLHDWYIGQAVASTGQYSIYVSNDGGQSSAYTVDDSYNDGTSYTYAYRAFHFSQPGDYMLDFDWEGHGGIGTTGLVMLTDDLGLFVGDVRPSDSRYTLLDEDLDDMWDETPWAHRTDTFAIADTGIYYIAFCWLVEGLNGYTHAFAVDNISLDRISCSSVSHLELSSVSSDNMTFSWEPTGSDTCWLVSFDANPATLVYDTFFVATGLTPATSHTISVSAICGVGDTSSAVTLTGMTSCVIINDLPFSESFNDYTEGAESIPCWTKLGDGDVVIDDGRIGNGLKFDPDGEAEPFMIVLPEFGMNINTLQLSMYSRPRDQHSGYLYVGYITDITDASTFHSTLQLQRNDFLNDTNAIVYVQHTATFEDAPAGAYIAIRQVPYGSHRWWVVDDILVDTLGATSNICAAPSNLSIDYVSTTTAQLSWTAGGSESQWQLELGSTTQIVNTNPYTLTGLTPGTNYNVRIRAICNIGDSSDWSLLAGFTTAEETLDSCYAPSGLQTDAVTTTTAQLTWTAGGSEQQWELDLNGTTQTVSENPYTLSDLTPGTSYEVRLRAICDSVTYSGWSPTAYFVTEEETVDTCLMPTDLHVQSVTTTSALLAWTAGDDEQQWELEVDGSARVVSENPYTLSGLTPGTSHEVRIRAICGTENYSDWTAVVSLTTMEEGLEGIDAVAEHTFALYPNPASKAVTLRTSRQATLAILDINGRVLVRRTLLPGSSVLDISTLASGVYYVRWVSDELTMTQKLMVK